jgi:hypothetical protein
MRTDHTEVHALLSGEQEVFWRQGHTSLCDRGPSPTSAKCRIHHVGKICGAGDPMQSDSGYRLREP